MTTFDRMHEEEHKTPTNAACRTDLGKPSRRAAAGDAVSAGSAGSGAMHEDEVGSEAPLRPLIRIGSAAERPADAFAAVRDRSPWFAIDDHHIPSHRLFTFLMFSFTDVTANFGEPKRRWA